jgi:hypothetical protein
MPFLAPPHPPRRFEQVEYYNLRGDLLWSEAALSQREPIRGDWHWRNGTRYTVVRFAVAASRLIVNLVVE